MKRFLAVLAVLCFCTVAEAQDVQMNQTDHNSSNLDNNTSQSETNHAVTASAIVGTWNDSNLFATQGVMFTSLMGWGYSGNGGASFSDAGAVPIPSGSGLQGLGDPAIVADSTGHFYIAQLITNNGGFNITGLAVVRSTNTAPPITLATPIQLTPMNAGDDFDKELMAIDRSGGPFDGRVYVAISEGNFFIPPAVRVVVAHSTGTSPLTFSSWQSVSPADALNHGTMPAVGPNGEVYVVWGRYVFTGSSLTGESFRIVKSTDGGGTFVNPDAGDANPNKTIATATPAPGSLGAGTNATRTRDFPYIAVDSTPAGSPTRGNVYVVFQADPDGAGGDKVDIFFTRSTDGGAHWSTPRDITSGPAVQVGRDTTTRDNWMPSITVSPVNGHIYVSLFDRRNDPANTAVRRYVALSTDGGLTWKNSALSMTSFTPSTGYDPLLAGGYFGDYNWAAADSNGIHLTWADSRNPCTPPGGAANPCSPSGRGDQDAYYRQVANLSGPDLFIQPWGDVTGIGPRWQTPDIFVVDAMDSPINALKGVVNRLRARVRNIGNAPAAGVVVRFKYAPWFAGITDAALKEIGTVNVDFSAAGGGTDTSIVPIDWDLTDLTDNNGGLWPAPISDFDHFCVKVSVEFAGDVNLSNNMAQNNFFDVQTQTQMKALRFLVGNPSREQTLPAQIILNKLPAGFRVAVRIDGVPAGEEQKLFRLKPGEIRLAKVQFTVPPNFRSRQDVVADISLRVGRDVVGGISARLYRAKGRAADLSGLGPFKAPLPQPAPAQGGNMGKPEEPVQRADPGFQPRTIPDGVRFRQVFKADFDTTLKMIIALLQRRNEGVSLSDRERGLVNTVSINLTNEQLLKLITPEQRKRADGAPGRYLLSFYLHPVEGGTEVGVASLILTRDLADSPLGGRALKSNGTLERQHLEELARMLPK
ncbi:MAG TPA: sialidase family protein [Thermoanaerobaculia bacterium]|nr:sialidase family protein [Thermoanaerobaculia bacterium]